MPYPMTRRCVGVGGNELNFHSFTSCGRFVDMAEALQRYSQAPRLMQLCGEAMHMPACASADFALRELQLFTPASSKHLPELVWLPILDRVDPHASLERMPEQATAYRLFKMRIIRDFQAADTLLPQKLGCFEAEVLCK